MCVGVQRKACGEVTQHSADRLDVYAILESDGCEGVAEVVESDLRDSGSFQNTLQHIIDTVRGNRTAVGRREHIGVIVFRFCSRRTSTAWGEILTAR